MKYNIKKFTFIFLIGLFFVGTAYATNHYVLGYSSVDNGEIRWGGSTVYSSQWNAAVNTWNSMDPINILPDTWWTYEDVMLVDIYRPDLKMAGGYEYFWYASDHIYFNKYQMNQFPDNSYRQNVATHELGHALGLDHCPGGWNIMIYYATFWTNLGPQDKSDYNYLWN